MKQTLLLTACVALSCNAKKLIADEISNKLNVILIMTDDQGYGDVGFTGNPYIKTPNLDKFASESCCFTNFHTATTSAPTRSGVMTGKYCNEVGVWHTIQGRSILEKQHVTIAEIFKGNGYKTGLFGKWHLGDNAPFRPGDRGFDKALWHKGGGVGQTPDYWLNDYFDDTYFNEEDEPVKQKGYCTDVFFGKAIEFVKENKDKPFFCCITPNAPHGPYHVSEKYAKQYRNNPNIPVPEFYGMITNIDDNFGTLMSTLKELDIDRETIVIFCTDNGSAGGVKLNKKNRLAEKGYNAGMRGVKGDVFDGGHRTPLVINIPGNKPLVTSQLAGYIDVAPTLIEICGLKTSVTETMDGISLASVINEYKTIDRYLIADTQRNEFLSEETISCVMKGNWRLINKKQLYNVALDPGEQKDMADGNPDLVNELKQVYDEWWAKTSKANERMSHIYLPIEKNKSTVLNCHDMHDPLNRPSVWNQNLMRTDMKPAPGFWAIEVKEDGRYNFELYRWPVESDLKLTEAAQEGEEIPNGHKYKAGGGIKEYSGAKLTIGGYSKKIKVRNADKKRCVEFSNIRLKKGMYKMEAHFILPTDTIGAYYIKITRK